MQNRQAAQPFDRFAFAQPTLRAMIFSRQQVILLVSALAGIKVGKGQSNSFARFLAVRFRMSGKPLHHFWRQNVDVVRFFRRTPFVIYRASDAHRETDIRDLIDAPFRIRFAIGKKCAGLG